MNQEPLVSSPIVETKKYYAIFRATEGKIERPSIKRQKSALQSFIEQADEKSKSKTENAKMEQ